MIRAGLILCAALAVSGCGPQESDIDRPLTATPEALNAHAEEFREEVIEVTEGVHVAVGFGIANSILIEGEDGLIIVDTMESLEAAGRIAERFRAISDKPVKALVYTHSHPDHILGAGAFVNPDAPVRVFAHETMMAQADKTFSVLQPIITRRSMFMYGNQLPPEERSNVGIGPFVDAHEGTTAQMIRPNETFSDRLEVEVAGVRMVMEHAPGETDDQILVWLPDHNVLLSGDNFYKAFPNLYTIRGTSFRDPKQWADSIDRMRKIRPEYLIPSHGRPLSGAENIHEKLTRYRDGIRYVYDQTVRMMNAALSEDEIAHRIELPPHLAGSPYLQPFYGKPEWSARSTFGGLLGWFDGNTSNLHPTPPEEKARRITRLAGGSDALAKEVKKAAAGGEHQWVLELTDYLLAVAPEHEEGLQHRIEALRALAEQEANPAARHFYLTEAGELAGELTVPKRVFDPTDAMLTTMPLERFFDAMSVSLDPEASSDVRQKVAFEFPDLEQAWTLEVRRGVTELHTGIHEQADIHVQVDSLDFKRLLAEQSGPLSSIVMDFDYIQGGRIGFTRFMSLFDPELD